MEPRYQSLVFISHLIASCKPRASEPAGLELGPEMVHFQQSPR